MSRLPESDEGVAKFVKEVNRLMGAVRAATAQGFALADGHAVHLDEGTGEVLDETVSDVDEGTLRTLLARYGEVETKRGNPAGEVPPFEVSASISQIAAEKIDADYIEKMFHDYIAAVGAGAPSEEQQAALNALHNEFPKLSREDQLIADQLITEIQTGTFEVREGWRFSDYVDPGEDPQGRRLPRRDLRCARLRCGHRPRAQVLGRRGGAHRRLRPVLGAARDGRPPCRPRGARGDRRRARARQGRHARRRRAPARVHPRRRFRRQGEGRGHSSA